MSKAFNDHATWWNSYIAPQLEDWCPVEKRSFDAGSATTCPYCHGHIGPSHWKWFSKNEPRPTP